MNTEELLVRLDTEADSVKEGSYQHSLCCDASDCIRRVCSSEIIIRASFTKCSEDAAELNKRIEELEECVNRATQSMADKDKRIAKLQKKKKGR